MARSTASGVAPVSAGMLLALGAGCMAVDGSANGAPVCKQPCAERRAATR